MGSWAQWHETPGDLLAFAKAAFVTATTPRVPSPVAEFYGVDLTLRTPEYPSDDQRSGVELGLMANAAAPLYVGPAITALTAAGGERLAAWWWVAVRDALNVCGMWFSWDDALNHFEMQADMLEEEYAEAEDTADGKQLLADARQAIVDLQRPAWMKARALSARAVAALAPTTTPEVQAWCALARNLTRATTIAAAALRRVGPVDIGNGDGDPVPHSLVCLTPYDAVYAAFDERAGSWSECPSDTLRIAVTPTRAGFVRAFRAVRALTTLFSSLEVLAVALDRARTPSTTTTVPMPS